MFFSFYHSHLLRLLNSTRLGTWTLAFALLVAHPQAAAQAPGSPAELYQQASEAAPQKTLFALGAMLCGAASVANDTELASLHSMLLDCPAEPAVDDLFPIRGRMLQHVRCEPLASRRQARDFLLTHSMAVTNLNALVVQLVGPAPSFPVIAGGAVAGLSDSWTAQDRLTLSHLLRDTWEQAHLTALWQSESPQWQAAQLDSGMVRHVAYQLDHFMDLPQSQALHLTYVTINPLMPAGSGVTSIFTDNHYAIILGPSANTAETQTLLAHELSHPLINAFFHSDVRAQLALQRASCVYDAVNSRRDGRAGIGRVYVGWNVYFAETMARTISHHLMQTPESPDGFVLQSIMSQELRRYDTNHRSFEELMVHSLGHLQNAFCSSPTSPRPDHNLAATLAHRSRLLLRRA